jgi:cytoskeletal protein RodZ
MKEDYLWDKTGNDAEIERLENSLKSFRYKETAPPNVISAKKSLVVEKPSRRNFSFSFASAFATCVFLILILVGVWLRFANNKSVENFSKTSSTPDIVAVPLKEIEPQPLISTDKAVKPATKIKFERKERIVPRKMIQRRNNVPKNKTEDDEIIVTAEEKEAFDQLMLALLITSEKLKLVRDKVNGAEYQTVVNKPKK